MSHFARYFGRVQADTVPEVDQSKASGQSLGNKPRTVDLQVPSEMGFGVGLEGPNTF